MGNRVFKYRRESFKDGVLVHDEVVSIHEDMLLSIMYSRTGFAFETLLKNWNAQGQRPNIGNMTYRYTKVEG